MSFSRDPLLLRENDGPFSPSQAILRKTQPGLVSYESPQSFRYTPQRQGSDGIRRSSRPQERESQVQGHELTMYIDRVTATWSDLEDLTYLPINSLPQPTILALERAFQKLLEYHTFSKTLGKDHDHLSKANRSLSAEKEVLINEIRERDLTIQELQSSLKAFRDSPRTGITTATHSRQGSDGIRRSPNTNRSLKAVGGNDLLTLRERVAELEQLLKTQQLETVNRMSPEKELERIDDIQSEYANLETFALNQMKLVVDHVAKQLPEEDRLKVIFGVLVVALERSKDMQESLKTAVRKLMNHPDRYLSVAPSGEEEKNDKPLGYRSSLIVRENVKMFENKESGQVKDPREQAALREEHINKVYHCLRDLLNETVDTCKLHALEKEVTEVLKEEYRATVHASLWFDSKYTKFLGDCCRLAWKISLTDRDIVLNSAPFEFYNEKRHLPYRSEANPRSRVDFFAWPVLIDMDSKYVLHRGRAHLS